MHARDSRQFLIFKKKLLTFPIFFHKYGQALLQSSERVTASTAISMGIPSKNRSSVVPCEFNLNRFLIEINI